jgi:hypothetical protein
MLNKLAVASGLAVLLGGAGVASAGGSKGSIGIGAERTLGDVLLNVGNNTVAISGLGGISANYDMGEFHLGGFLGFSDDGGTDDTDVAVGGRFYYHLHSSAMADFGIGGGIGIGIFGDRTGAVDDNATVLLLEPGFQMRAFVASNVALSFSAGLTLGLADADGVTLSGQPNGAAGVHYYFF